MIIKPVKHIAYKCPCCGKLMFGNFSVFDIKSEPAAVAECVCGMSDVKLSSDGRIFKLVIPCFACEVSHTYSLNRSALSGKQPVYVSCPDSVLPTGCIGSFDETGSWAEDLEELIDSLYEELREDEYFVNGEIVCGIVDRISELVDMDKVECPGGHFDFEYVLTENSVVLYCCECGAKKEFPAETDEDLQNAVRYDKIILQTVEKKNNIIDISNKED